MLPSATNFTLSPVCVCVCVCACVCVCVCVCVSTHSPFLPPTLLLSGISLCALIFGLSPASAQALCLSMSLSKHYVSLNTPSLSLCVQVSVYHMPLSKHYVSLCLSVSTMSLYLSLSTMSLYVSL